MTPAELIDAHYKIQNGMYFSGKMTQPGFVLYNSRILSEAKWNFARLLNYENVDASVQKAETLFHRLGRKSCFYFAEKEDVPERIQQKYQPVLSETWLRRANAEPVAMPDEAVLANTPRLQDEFIRLTYQIFNEDTISAEWGERQNSCQDAIRQSFGYPQYYNFMVYRGGDAVSAATLGIKDGVGGIYNIGTLSKYREQGWGQKAAAACIAKWQELGGRCLFLIVAEKELMPWCQKAGFSVVFDGTAYACDVDA